MVQIPGELTKKVIRSLFLFLYFYLVELKETEKSILAIIGTKIYKTKFTVVDAESKGRSNNSTNNLGAPENWNFSPFEMSANSHGESDGWVDVSTC